MPGGSEPSATTPDVAGTYIGLTVDPTDGPVLPVGQNSRHSVRPLDRDVLGDGTTWISTSCGPSILQFAR